MKMATLQQELPLVLVHRPEAFDFRFRVRLESQFRLLDPFDSPAEPLQSFLSGQARSVRSLLCVDPTPISAELLLLPSLQLIVGSTAGVDHIHLAECRRRLC
ncbi:NAD(P)-binding domain containing protein [Parasponia andersonii]|uniref:NAD(P)-binding domain containing protein n=1 Tax=Parasponia andersonii TaxID=3476 RepID=A0A2P5C8U2_PARAD|nr:NAD(P)-binding domain containing protein [Parasponia andersonii]